MPQRDDEMDDDQTDGAAGASAEQKMRNTEAYTTRDTNRVEPILDASGTLRRNVLRKLGAERAEQADTEGRARPTR
ncbi:MAG: hypothetical protein KF899_06545 [Parvibaculum sp.]|nr:hypothetical protein [Parvibaculum sp.]